MIRGKINQKDYKFYVVVENNDNYRILTGWEYLNDAKDDLKETQDENERYPAAKIYTKRFLISKG